MELKKISKNSQKWENATSNEMFLSPKSNSKINFCQFLAQQKVAKNAFFVIFVKTVSFGQNLT